MQMRSLRPPRHLALQSLSGGLKGKIPFFAKNTKRNFLFAVTYNFGCYKLRSLQMRNKDLDLSSEAQILAAMSSLTAETQLTTDLHVI